MTKLTLATQLRFHFARQGFPTGEIARNSDDAMIAMIAGRCGWCGKGGHVVGEQLDQIISLSLDEQHFRSLWNDCNNLACPKVRAGEV
jgi:hypothetical protein